jgi:hypothetical protein
MKRPSLLSLLLSLVVIAGCQGGKSGPSDTPEPSTQNGGASSTGGATTGGETPEPATNVAVPEELQTAAYHWLGLGYGKAIKYTIKGNNRELNGEQTISPKSAEDGKVIYTVMRTGDLASQLGIEEWSLEKDGVYAISNTRVTTSVREMQAPANMDPGKTWTSNTKAKMQNGGSTVDVAQNLTYKVVGEQSVTTPVGKQQALLVKATGTLKIGEISNRVEASFWYVKDKGMVKNVLKNTNLKDPKEPAAVITIEEAK